MHAQPNSPSLTEQLATWLVAQRQRGWSQSAIDSASTYLIDWLASALASQQTVQAQIVRDYAKAQPAGNCGIVGSGMRRSAEIAALTNGALSHIVEMDDIDRASVVHPAAVIIPAALATAERTGASGHAFLSAIVAGYEIAIRIGTAVGKRHYFYFHNTATCGVFGAAAAAGWLLGLDAEQLVWALGNAGTQAAGLWQFNADGDMSKHLHAGMAAANGVRSAELAARGFSGPRHILEGERGFFAATAPDAQPETVVAGLGTEPLKIGGVSIKPHASCRHTHPAIDAALALRPQLGGRAIAACDVYAYRAALDLCDNATPDTDYAAKFSLHYCVAAALQDGAVGLTAFAPPRIAAPERRTLLARTHAHWDAQIEQRYPAAWSARVVVTLQDGSVLEQSVLAPKGDPENRLTRDELLAKFDQLARFGGHAPGGWRAWLTALPDAPTVRLPAPTPDAPGA